MNTINIGLKQDRRALFLIGVMIIFYVVGTIGILLPLHKDFILLTPFNLLLSLGLVLAYHQEERSKMAWLLLGCYLWGWLVEMLGVNTGLIFGEYTYGKVLGPKILGTPLMIGVNWALLIYCAGCWTNRFFLHLHWIWKAAFTSILMVMLDLLIEPVAMQYGFWDWENSVIPIQNYIAWFFVALPLAAFFARLFPRLTNIVARVLFIIQIVFFFILGAV